MTTRTVRLDDDAEQALARLRKVTRLSISEVLRRGLVAYEKLISAEGYVRPYDLYAQLDLGEGGWSQGAARSSKQAATAAVRRKHRR